MGNKYNRYMYQHQYSFHYANIWNILDMFDKFKMIRYGSSTEGCTLKVPSLELTGTFDNVKMDGSRAYLPAYLLWNHYGSETQGHHLPWRKTTKKIGDSSRPYQRVPFPEVDLKEVPWNAWNPLSSWRKFATQRKTLQVTGSLRRPKSEGLRCWLAIAAFLVQI